MLRRAAFVALMACTAFAASGCIGATDRADFDEEVRRRGGGVSETWIADGIEQTAAAVAVPTVADLDVVSISITPSSRSLTTLARRGDRPEFVDTVVVREGSIDSITPVQDADELPLDQIVISIAQVPLGDIELLADRAIEEFGEPDGFVTGIDVLRRDGRAVVEFDLESARRTGAVVFAADGTVIGVER